MARFGMQDMDNYGGGPSNYFSLKDDGDTALIRFLYNDTNDIEGVAVHDVEVDGKHIDVECLRAYNEPVSKCPLCEAGYKVNAKLYIPVYDEDAKESKIWTRGRTFFNKLSILSSKFNPLVATPFEVQRVGRKGDTNTSYETFPTQSDNKRITDFPEINAEGIAFQVKTPDELLTYLETGSFGEAAPARRPAQAPTRRPVQAQRETPANTPVRRRPTYNNEDTF